MPAWTDLFDRRGFQSRLASRFSLSKQTINEWRKGIPVPYCAGVAEECDREFERWDFRPDDWHTIWPELIGTAGAPAVPSTEAA